MGLISVTKCHGTGNDFIILDVRGAADLPYSLIARTLCERRFSIGADGLLVLGDPQKPSADASMRIFNADGSEAEMCGNGIRCIARYLYEENLERTEASIGTPSGVTETKIVTWDGTPAVRVMMGEPKFEGGSTGKLDRSITLNGESAPTFGVSIGNSHIVVFTAGDPTGYDLEKAVHEITTWGVFDSQPNVELAQVVRDGIRMRVHERGVGETWACGSGACAVAAAAIATGQMKSPVALRSKGGLVRVEWQGSGNSAYLTGNAELIFRTDVDAPSGVETIQIRLDGVDGQSP